MAAFYGCKLITKNGVSLVSASYGCQLTTKGLAVKWWPLMGVS